MTSRARTSTRSAHGRSTNFMEVCVSQSCLRNLFIVLACVLVAQRAAAQSTIFNVPTTDTVEKGKGYFEFDFLPQAPGPDTGSRIIIYNPRLIGGVPHDVEVGVNVPVFHNGDFDPSSLAYAQPNVKWKYYKNDDKGVAAAVGVVGNVPLNSRDSQLAWAYVYGNISKKVKSGNYGPRFTAGPYGVFAKQDDPVKVGFLGTRGGVLLGYEQPLSDKISFVADWFSGKNSIGYFTPGISIALPYNSVFNAGYGFGNDSWEHSNATRNRYVFLYYGVT